MENMRIILIGAMLAVVCGCAGVPVKRTELEAMSESQLISQLNRAELIEDSYVGWNMANTTKKEYLNDIWRRLFKLDSETREVLSSPLDYIVPKDKSAEPWERAKKFITRFSPMKLQVDTEVMLQTHDPINKADFGYSVAKIAMGHDVRFIIKCNSPQQNGKAGRNARVLAYYMQTSRLLTKYVNR